MSLVTSVVGSELTNGLYEEFGYELGYTFGC